MLPLAACEPSHGVWRQAKLPSLPATTLWPPTTSSMSHLLGTICHITKQPFSETPPREALAPAPAMATEPAEPPKSSPMPIVTFPVAKMFFTLPSNFLQPAAAVKCCMIYCADEHTCCYNRLLNLYNLSDNELLELIYCNITINNRSKLIILENLID